MDTEQYKIIHLPKEQWKNVPIPMRYTTEEYYDVRIEKDGRQELLARIETCPEEWSNRDIDRKEVRLDKIIIKWRVMRKPVFNHPVKHQADFSVCQCQLIFCQSIL